MSHADRYKKMLINDFDWDEKDIEACNNEDIFRPKNIGVHKASRSDEVQQEDNNRIDKICNLIKLHIHVRLLMMCELMTIHIDLIGAGCLTIQKTLQKMTILSTEKYI